MPIKKTPKLTPAPSLPGGEPNKYLATICYLGIFWVVPLALGQKDEFVLWHAKQGIVLSIAWPAALMLLWIPFLNFFIALPAIVILSIINVLAIMKTWRGERWSLPFLAHYVKVLGL